jgi:hypothetical protein
VARDEPHVNVGGLLDIGLFFEETLFWAQAYFWEKYLFWGKNYFWKERPNFGAHATRGKKATCRKRRKSNIQGEKKRGVQVDKPNHDRVRVFDKDCNRYKPKK